MNRAKLLSSASVLTDRSLRPKKIPPRLWDQMVEVSKVAVRHHYYTPWERADG